jgi:ATP/maltotriose-dependent transcriptional regulator MalT
LTLSADAILIQGSDLDRAAALYEESQQLFREAGDRTGIVLTAGGLSQLAYLQGDDERVWKLQDEGAALIQTTGWLPFLAFSLCLRARIARRQGNYGYAREALAKCLAFSQEGGFWRGFEYPLALLGGLAVDQRKPARAAKMLGAVRTYFEAFSKSRDPYRRAILTEFEHDIAAARAQLGEEAFAATYAEGQMMTLDQVIAFALDERQVAAHSG